MEISAERNVRTRVDVKKEGVVLDVTALPFENEGVLNPAVIRDTNGIHIFYRAVSAGNRSTIGYALFSDPLTISYRSQNPVLIPEFDFESQGVEDPRIACIDGTYFMTYTAYDGYMALGALALSTDLAAFEKQGVIAPRISYEDFRQSVDKSTVNAKYFRFDQSSRLLWDKNIIFFPQRIDGKLAFLHRIRPGIQLVLIDSLSELTETFWKKYFADFKTHIVLDPKYGHELSYIGGGCPPIKTDHGWLLIYHSVRDTISGYVYSACAALIDLEDPTKEIARLPYPLFSPETDWEISGEVDNVCFPTGSVLSDGRLFIYYGAADKRIACASVDYQELLEELNNSRRL